VGRCKGVDIRIAYIDIMYARIKGYHAEKSRVTADRTRWGRSIWTQQLGCRNGRIHYDETKKKLGYLHGWSHSPLPCLPAHMLAI